jgi:hypothetical protein
MAVAEHRMKDQTRQPDGIAGEGMDSYPTYRDGPTTPHRATGTKATDVELPVARRTYALPILIGLAVFALVIVARILWGAFNMAESMDEAMTPGDAPAAVAPAEPADAAAGAAPQNEGALDQDVGADTATGPAAIGAAPGSVDVPGGAMQAPAQPAQ